MFQNYADYLVFSIVPFLVVLGLNLIESLLATRNKKNKLIEFFTHSSLKSDLVLTFMGVIFGWTVLFVAAIFGYVCLILVNIFIFDTDANIILLFLVPVAITNLLPRLFIRKENRNYKGIRYIKNDVISKMCQNSNRNLKLLFSYLTFINFMALYILVRGFMYLIWISPTNDVDFYRPEIKEYIVMSIFWLIFFFSAFVLLIEVSKINSLLLVKNEELEKIS